MNIDTYISSGVIESYVLGMAEAQEVAELLQLSKQYPQIKKAIDDFEASLQNAAFSNAVKPPDSVKNQLMLLLNDEFVKEVSPIEENKVFINENIATLAPVKKMSVFKYVAAASIILLVVSMGLNAYFYTKYNEANSQVVALLNEKNNLTAQNKTYQVNYSQLYSSIQLMSDTNIIKVSLKGIAGKEANLATVFWDNKSKDVYLLANKLPEAPRDKQYQLWGLVDGKPVNLGVLENCNGVCKLNNISKAQAFAITLETKVPGGKPTPDLSQLQVLGKV